MSIFIMPGIDLKCQSCFYFQHKKCAGIPVHTDPECHEKRKEIHGKKGGRINDGSR